MPSMTTERSAMVLLSGGVDSAVLADYLLCGGWRVVPCYVRTGCAWETLELAAVRSFLSAIQHGAPAALIVLDMPLGDLYGKHWSMTGVKVPNDTTGDDAVFLPGRNPLLLLKPAVWCQMHGIPNLALATLASNPFADATPAFFAAFEAMIFHAISAPLRILRPFEHFPKHRVMQLGAHLPLELTFSCLAPVDGMHCGRCNKCAERRRAFRQIDLPDRTPYHQLEMPVRYSPGEGA